MLQHTHGHIDLVPMQPLDALSQSGTSTSETGVSMPIRHWNWPYYPRFVWQIPVGDFMRPDGVTMPDFSLFAGHWLDDKCDISNDYCEGTDLDLSGAVDINDLQAFADNWLAAIAP
jgi:hypothetical protein